MKVYRFEKNETTRLQTIIDKSLWISRPQEFNDLNDCELDGIETPPYDSNLYTRLRNCIETLYPSEHPIYFPLADEILMDLKEFFSNTDSSLKTQIAPLLKRNLIIHKIRTYLKEKTGVCCFFQGEPKHPLMWAHYANNHTGFCIEYEVEDADHQLTEVNYTSIPVKPSITELLLCPEETILRILSRKSLEWNYEKEFRLIYINEFPNNETGEKIPLPHTMKAIRLIKGAKFENEKNKELMNQIALDKISYKSFNTNNNNFP